MSDSKSRKTPPYSQEFLEDSQDEESYTESDSQADFTILSDGTRCYFPRPPSRPTVVPAAVGPVPSASIIITGNAEPSPLLEDDECTAGKSLGTNKRHKPYSSNTVRNPRRLFLAPASRCPSSPEVPSSPPSGFSSPFQTPGVMFPAHQLLDLDEEIRVVRRIYRRLLEKDVKL
ncbi:hypothetical protein D9613_012184 [Agrocybe pediades]|uniref:Uncharacterized protein n=1 Tax=Agrocybe pediades TaxID=84607 RepID=A0A8H4VVH3_9AGAR|nr:hypothetical protein D9613_012184 [Agrocybe pediades]